MTATDDTASVVLAAADQAMIERFADRFKELGWDVRAPDIVQMLSEEELVALLELSAKVWVELPPFTRADYGRELERHHGLRVGDADLALAACAACHCLV